MTGRAEHDASTTHELTVQVRREGRVVAAADVATPGAPHGTAHVAISTPHVDAPRDARGELVDQVLDHPEVQDSDSVHVVVPIGDSAAIVRLQERTTNYSARAAGASSIIDAEVPRPAAEE